MQSRRYDIETLLDEVITLPSMPETLEQITALINDPDSALGDVAKVISRDPAIALKTLRLVNSAYYGLGKEISSIEQAVVLLGSKVIRNMVLTAAVFETIQGSTEKLLRHSLACGLAMRILVEEGPLSNLVVAEDEAFIFGLLHDIGKVFIDEYLNQEAAAITELIQRDGYACFQAEMQQIGADHAMIGGCLAEKWCLSPALINAIMGHHELDLCDEEYQIFAASLCIADYMAATCGYTSHERGVYLLPDLVWRLADLDGSRMATITTRFLESLPTIDELIKMS